MMCMFILRDYQIECLDSIKKHFKNFNTQLVQMPTGAGKTVVFWHYLFANKGKSIIVCPTKDLVSQTYEKGSLILSALSDIKTTLYAKTSKIIQKADHYIVTAASLWRDTTLNFFLEEKIDTIILDECHHSCSRTYQYFINKLIQKNPKLKVIGFTATPERLDKGDLLTTFGKITFQRNVLDLIEKGYLCDVCAYKIKTGQSFSDKVVSGGDFSQVALKDLDNHSRNNLIIKTYEENCKGKKTLIFCVNVDHSERLAKAMEENGIKVKSIHGGLTTTQRKYIIESFRNGEIDVLTNCQLLTEGFDEPSIESLIIARPTKSKALYCQMVGRGLRNSPGKSLCYLYELADNSHKICTFDVMAFEKKPSVEYPNGVNLTNLRREVEKISLEIVELKREKLNIFNRNMFSDFKYMHEIGMAYNRYKDRFPNSPCISAKYYDFRKIHKNFPRLLDFRNLDFMKEENIKEAIDIFWREKDYLPYTLAEEYIFNLLQMVNILNKAGFSRYNIFVDIYEFLKSKKNECLSVESRISEAKKRQQDIFCENMKPIMEEYAKSLGLR